MKAIRKSFESSPLIARVAPFIVFIALTLFQGRLGEGSHYWIYLAKTLVGLWLVLVSRPFVSEMRWAFGWEAVAVGVAVFIMWVGIDPFYPRLPGMGQSTATWNPIAHYGQGSAMAWLFILTRILGSTFVVPQIEEVFYRSFLYRYIMKQDFVSVPLGTFAWTPFIATAAVFGLAHHQWLAGILCGMAYQWLVIRKQRLGDAMTAHAITNFLLGLWVVWKNAWHFW
ncbi:MAG: CAAX prenyl protease-related protein [Verrucomicrobiota bacterium]|nr:CAAX prenyl protease-related protein [Verrucomicrobiota bacterium]